MKKMRRKFRIFKGIGKNSFVQTIMGRLLYTYVWFVYKTSRWSMDGLRDEYINGDFSYFITFWHGRSFSDMFLVLDKKLQKQVSVLISLHRDGRIMASAMKGLGIETINGSSKRGGAVAALEMIRTLNKPANIVALSPDGRKPGYKMTEGLIHLARKSQKPIVLSAFSVRYGKILKTWDKYLFPFLFNKGIVLFSEPIYIPKDLDRDGIENWRQILEDRLIDLTEEADRRVGLKGRIPLRMEGTQE